MARGIDSSVVVPHQTLRSPWPPAKVSLLEEEINWGVAEGTLLTWRSLSLDL